MLAELPPAYSLLIECQLCAVCLMQVISACSLQPKKDAGQDRSSSSSSNNNPITAATVVNLHNQAPGDSNNVSAVWIISTTLS